MCFHSYYSQYLISLKWALFPYFTQNCDFAGLPSRSFTCSWQERLLLPNNSTVWDITAPLHNMGSNETFILIPPLQPSHSVQQPGLFVAPGCPLWPSVVCLGLHTLSGTVLPLVCSWTASGREQQLRKYWSYPAAVLPVATLLTVRIPFPYTNSCWALLAVSPLPAFRSYWGNGVSILQLSRIFTTPCWDPH